MDVFWYTSLNKSANMVNFEQLDVYKSGEHLWNVEKNSKKIISFTLRRPQPARWTILLKNGHFVID